MTVFENPCLACPDTCCALQGECGLRLSQIEFEAHFKEREKGLRVRREGKIIVISSREGLVCPNLGPKGCQVYHNRPIDCRLYPYQMLPVYETRKKVKFLLYMISGCVEKKIFHVTESEARTLVKKFGRQVYGEKEIVIQVFDNRFFPKLKNKFEIVSAKVRSIIEMLLT